MFVDPLLLTYFHFTIRILKKKKKKKREKEKREEKRDVTRNGYLFYRRIGIFSLRVSGCVGFAVLGRSTQNFISYDFIYDSSVPLLPTV